MQMAGTVNPKLHEFILDGRKVAILDTPGFDDTYKTDAEVLETVADFLAATYRKKLRLSGIIYLYRITDVRLSHGGLANLLMFRALCGDDPLRKVVLATTFWGDVKNLERAREHEEELKTTPEYWGDMLSKKATMTQFHDTQESALNILRSLLEREEKISLKIQKEMVDEDLDLGRTSAGETLNRELNRMAEKYAKDLERHKADMRAALEARDYEMQEIKQEQTRRTENLLQTMQNQQEVLNANRRDELRERDMLLDEQEARFRKALKEQEVSLSFDFVHWREEKAKHLQAEAIEQQEIEIRQLKEAKAKMSESPKKYEKQIMEKEKAKAKREKVLEILGAVGTTATAAGLSVINPLAIPVAFSGLINLINACFSRRDEVRDRTPAQVNSTAVVSIAAS